MSISSAFLTILKTYKNQPDDASRDEFMALLRERQSQGQLGSEDLKTAADLFNQINKLTADEQSDLKWLFDRTPNSNTANQTTPAPATKTPSPTGMK